MLLKTQELAVIPLRSLAKQFKRQAAPQPDAAASALLKCRDAVISKQKSHGASKPGDVRV